MIAGHGRLEVIIMRYITVFERRLESGYETLCFTEAEIKKAANRADKMHTGNPPHKSDWKQWQMIA